MPACCGKRERAVKEAPDVGEDIDAFIPFRPIVHDDDGRPGFSDHGGHVRIFLQAPYIIDDNRTGFHRSRRDRGLAGIDGERHIEDASQRRQDLLDARKLLGLGHRNRGRPRRLSADIDHVASGNGHGLGMSDGGIESLKSAAIRERIRGQVQNSHDGRTGLQLL